ncbi:MAG: hypothetical protein HLX50_24740, partial [Alteromonadaceae bacterium]|nr:hypothetical protein [Alteromonadaceae bacterium]
VSADGTYLCSSEGCTCRVADDENHVKSAEGIFCSEDCAEGKGCQHPGCNCASKDS